MVFVGIQGIFPGSGGSAEFARTLTVAASQEKGGRVAIVIGNSKYPSGALANPKNDASAIAASLKKLGFDVELKLDASKADMVALIKRFSGKAEKASVAALFYAGHGIQANGSNYIVPIDANPKSERDLKWELVKMDDVIDDMGSAAVKLVFFDACRDNPLSRSFGRGGSRGMAAPVEATGTLISFATKHGNIAADGDTEHSPYTAALLASLENSEGVEIEQMLRKVQQGVKRATNGRQEPWRYGSLDGDFYFKAGELSPDMAKVQQDAVDRAVLETMRQANEQAAREKAELQQSIKAQQETLRRANEQAAIERAELQQSLKAQQVASDRAMAEEIKRSKEQAARERAELQQSMEKMLKEALARQNAAMEAERTAWLAASGEPAKTPTAARPGTTPSKIAQTQQSIQLASIAPATVGSGSKPSEQVLGTISSAIGDEWEYVAKDTWGKQQKVIARVNAVVAGTGVLEAYSVDGNEAGEWVFDGKPSLIGIPIDASLLFSPYWSGSGIESITVLNGSRFPVMGISGKVVGDEKITVPAGTFDTKRLELQVAVGTSVGAGNLEVVVWYSIDQKRLVRQTVKGRHHGPTIGHTINALRETIELLAFRPAAK